MEMVHIVSYVAVCGVVVKSSHRLTPGRLSVTKSNSMSQQGSTFH